jgi:hypothetical protein
MSDDFPADIYTEPAFDIDTLKNLGPLAPMAGIWTGERGLDVKPKADGPRKQAFVERIELQPVDPQTNGPQLLYGLRYHLHITKPQQIKTYHEQVGYWLWEPATGKIIQTLTIPRGQTAMAVGFAAPDAKRFELKAVRGSELYGICSTEFIDTAFRTTEYRIAVTINDDGSWGYEEDTVLMIRGQTEPFHHTDRNLLTRIAAPTPNPLVRQVRAEAAPG